MGTHKAKPPRLGDVINAQLDAAVPTENGSVLMRELIARALIRIALGPKERTADKLKAIDQIHDYTEGRPAQSLRIGLDDGDSLSELRIEVVSGPQEIEAGSGSTAAADAKKLESPVDPAAPFKEKFAVKLLSELEEEAS